MREPFRQVVTCGEGGLATREDGGEELVPAKELLTAAFLPEGTSPEAEEVFVENSDLDYCCSRRAEHVESVRRVGVLDEYPDTLLVAVVGVGPLLPCQPELAGAYLVEVQLAGDYCHGTLHVCQITDVHVAHDAVHGVSGPLGAGGAILQYHQPRYGWMDARRTRATAICHGHSPLFA